MQRPKKGMQKMSGADLHFASAELAGLEGKRIAKIRKTSDGIYLFKIGSEELLFQPGVRLHLTRQAHQATQAPDGFVAYLRKHLEGKTAQKIMQHGTDRILEIEARSKERLVFELFRKGNIIFVGESGEILSCLNSEEAGGRKIARGEQYCYPKATAFELKVPPSPSFGVGLDKDGLPVSYSLEASQQDRLFPSFSQAADFYYANQAEESEAHRAAAQNIARLQQRLSSQQQALEELSGQKKAAKLAGDAIYSDFERVETLLSEVRRMKKEGRGEGEINLWLSKRGAALRGSELEVEL